MKLAILKSIRLLFLLGFAFCYVSWTYAAGESSQEQTWEAFNGKNISVQKGGAWGFEDNGRLENFLKLAYSLDNNGQCPDPHTDSGHLLLERLSRVLRELRLVDDAKKLLVSRQLAERDQSCLKIIVEYAETTAQSGLIQR